jgi:hypothetical protein
MQTGKKSEIRKKTKQQSKAANFFCLVTRFLKRNAFCDHWQNIQIRLILTKINLKIFSVEIIFINFSLLCGKNYLISLLDL